MTTQTAQHKPQHLHIAPSILSADFAKLGAEVKAIEAAGADWVHFDVMDNHYVPNLFNPATPLSLMDHVMDKLDVVLLMSVNPGFGGQKFIPETLNKLREARAKIDAYTAATGKTILLEVDGGVKVDNIQEIVSAGADVCVAGSAVFSAPDADGGYTTIMRDLRAQVG